MAATTHVPVEIYLRSSYEPDAEDVDGAIEERAAGEYDHAVWQEAICFWFRQHAHDWNVRVNLSFAFKCRRLAFGFRM
jgi:hypothetical protein